MQFLKDGWKIINELSLVGFTARVGHISVEGINTKSKIFL